MVKISLTAFFMSCLVILLLVYAVPESTAVGEIQDGQSENLFISFPFPVITNEATLLHPYKAGFIENKLPDPFWTEQGLWLIPSSNLYGLAKAEKKGLPIYDPWSRAFYASAYDGLVKLHQDGKLEVILENIQGTDLDVRASSNMMVVRETNNTIVLYQWNEQKTEKKVLLSGEQFFNPRFSRDGSHILVAESRTRGGHMRLVSLNGTTVDLGQGYGASWHPDGKRIIFSRIEHDHLKILASDLWIMDINNRTESRVTNTQALAEIEPAFSLDGKWLAFTDAKTNQVYVSIFSDENK